MSPSWATRPNLVAAAAASVAASLAIVACRAARTATTAVATATAVPTMPASQAIHCAAGGIGSPIQSSQPTTVPSKNHIHHSDYTQNPMDENAGPEYSLGVCMLGPEKDDTSEL